MRRFVEGRQNVAPELTETGLIDGSAEPAKLSITQTPADDGSSRYLSHQLGLRGHRLQAEHSL